MFFLNKEADYLDMKILIDPEKLGKIIIGFSELPLQLTYKAVSHRLYLLDELNNEILYIRLPVNFPPYTGLHSLHGDIGKYVILLIQSGYSAMGLFEKDKAIEHKAFTSYMVRKKQGKSQIKHLKTKGKSRAGSRIRLESADRFFYTINGRLETYFNNHTIGRIALSCSTTLIPYFFNEKYSPPFDKKDERIVRIPAYVNTPNYSELKKVHHFLLQAEIIMKDADHTIIDRISDLIP